MTAPEPTPNLPTIEDEVTRKALGEVRKLIEDYNCKRISKRELQLCLDSVWNAVSGCTRETFHEVIAATSQFCRELPPDDCAITVHKALPGYVVVSWLPGFDAVHIANLFNGQATVKQITCGAAENPTLAAHNKALEIRARLEVKGHHQIGGVG